MVKIAGIRAFQDHHPLVAAQLPGQLTVAHIDSVYLRCAVLQHAVGKAAGGGADICGDPAGEIQGKGIDGLFQLQPAPAHIAQAVSAHFQRNVFADRHAGLVQLPVSGKDFAGHDQRLGFLAAFRQAALKDYDIKPFLCHASSPPPLPPRRFPRPAPCFCAAGGRCPGL